MELISMTDFVLETKNKSITETEKFNIIEWQKKCEAFNKIITYASILKQPLKIQMFLPCDEVGNVLQKPKEKDYFDEGFPLEFNQKHFREVIMLEYNQAKEKVLFEGFEIGKFTGSKDNHFDYIGNKKLELILFIKDVGISNWLINDNKLKDIEDLIKYKLTLTENAIKQLKSI
jgi:hypothetical protein